MNNKKTLNKCSIMKRVISVKKKFNTHRRFSYFNDKSENLFLLNKNKQESENTHPVGQEIHQTVI